MKPRAFTLTADLVAAHSGGPVVCLDVRALGQVYRLHAERPGPQLNRPLRADVVSAEGVFDVEPADAVDTSGLVTRVDIVGALEQRAGFHDVCGGWSDGHDAVRERLEAAFAEGNVLLVVDSPGGAHAGLEEAVAGALRAKLERGRTVIALVNEMCGSACAWWVLALADEVYVVRSGILGSIGARASHVSIAGALAQAGEEVTYFAAPGPGKVAFAPELPLSDEGKRRGERDVWTAYYAFEAAVCAGPVGQRYGLTTEFLRSLKADALTGQAAVDAGLADGVATLEDVEQYALALASGGGQMPLRTEQQAAAKPPPGPNDDPDSEEGEGEDAMPPADKRECAGCGQANEDDAAFCKKCGGPMGPSSGEEEDDAGDGGPPPAPSAPPKKKAQPPPPQGARAARSTLTSAHSFEEILGLRQGASMPAAKSAALQMRRVVDRVAALTGTRNTGEMVGGLDRIEQDLGRLVQVEADARATQRKANAAERLDILKQLVALGGPEHTRGKLLEDVVDQESGKRVGVRPTKLWGPGPEGRSLPNLRGYLRQARASAPPTKTPFDPDPARAKDHAESHITEALVTDRDRELGAALGLDPKLLAASGQALFGPNGTARYAVARPE